MSVIILVDGFNKEAEKGGGGMLPVKAPAAEGSAQDIRTGPAFFGGGGI